MPLRKPLIFVLSVVVALLGWKVWASPDTGERTVWAAPAVRDDAKTVTAVRALLDRQTVDWNRGDLDAFATGYKNAPDILFIGSSVSRGYAAMLALYKRVYGTPEKRGVLSFSQLEVQPMSAEFATTTGHFHLERTAAGGGNADGYFLLVLENTAAGWKIVRDDTTALPAVAASH